MMGAIEMETGIFEESGAIERRLECQTNSGLEY